MEGSAFDELEFFRALEASGARALLIGRRALVVLGVPVLTADYDFWVHPDDLEAFNGAARRFDLFPSLSPAEGRAQGRYVLENDEHVDVICARTESTVGGTPVRFDDVWVRRRVVSIATGLSVPIPELEDLILTKQFAARPKDAEDIRLLETLRRSGLDRD
jgi:hypothetical protein